MTTAKTDQELAAERSDAKRADARQRPIMTSAELGEHRTRYYGRDYSKSDDGYGDMAVARAEGWRVIGGWGSDGWDLGDWPYVAMYVRDGALPSTALPVPVFELMQITEGDHTVYQFPSATDREAAIDYLFLWYAAGEDWAPLTYEDRARLDAGELTVGDQFRGPYGRGRVATNGVAQ